MWELQGPNDSPALPIDLRQPLVRGGGSGYRGVGRPPHRALCTDCAPLAQHDDSM